MSGLSQISRVHALALMVCTLTAGCGAPPSAVAPSIQFSKIPQAGQGGSQRLVTIEGRVTGASPGQRIVLFARSGVWWVQPFANEPFTTIQPDATWRSSIHLGTEYAALLVDASYRPPARTDELPTAGGSVLAVATVPGQGTVVAGPLRKLTFSGYEWQIRQVPSDRGGANEYDPTNAWTDADGALHLRIARREGEWTSAEVILTRSLGYGTYSFVVRDISHLEPAAAFGMFTWDDQGADQNHREVGIEISRWGDPANKNAQYVIQPYYVAANVARFAAPAGKLTHSFRWEPGRVSFKTILGALIGGPSAGQGRQVAQHDLTSGVPTPGTESIRINFYVFGYSSIPLKNGAEVVIEKFEYLP
jgi:hypothetical protein